MHRVASLQKDSLGVMRAVRMCSGRKPGFTCDSPQKLRISSPAAITRSTAKETSATTNPLRSRWDTEIAAPRAPNLRDSVRAARDECRAGARPKIKPVKIARPPVRPSTRQSMCTSIKRGVSAGSRALSKESPFVARINPSRPPTDASSTLSVSSCLTMRHRPAPKATRMPTSFSRVASRERVRLATLAQAIRRTSVTAPNSMRSRARTSATMPFCNCASLPRKLPHGNAAPHPCLFPSASAAALRSTMIESGSTGSYFLRLGSKDSSDHVCHAIQLFSFGLESAFPRRREPVIFGLAFVFRLAPFAGDPSLVLQPVQRRVQGTLLNLQPIFRNLLDAQQNAVAVQRAEGNSLEDQHVQRALQKVELFVHGSVLS